jgi:high-affinity K+ transport system ATPase subunit B
MVQIIFISIVVILSFTLPFDFHDRQLKSKSEQDNYWQFFDESILQNLIAQNKIIIVDVTADWCLTCKFNKMLVLNDKEITKKLKSGEIIPADSILISENASIDYSFVSGESTPVKVNKGDLIYAGAQKNLGPAGATLYIVKDEILGKSTSPFLPTYLDLKQHVEKESMYNTPPVFSIYVAMLNLRNLISNGGVKAMEVRNNSKATLLYNEIDSNPQHSPMWGHCTAPAAHAPR